MSIIPKRFPYWCVAISKGNRVFDLYWFGWWCLVIDHTKAYYPRGWILTWNDGD